MPRASPVRLTAFDAQGRVARRIVDRAVGAGWHQATWPADSGPGGVFFLRLQTPEGDRACRVVRLR